MRAVRMMILAAAAWLLVPAVTVLAVAPSKVYVADEGSDSVSVIDVASRTRVAVVEVGESPHNVQVSPDGTLAWVTNDGARGKDEAHKTMSSGEHGDMNDRGEVWAIDTATDTVVGKVQVGKHPAHVVLGPDGRYAYVTNGGEDTVSVVDVAARKVVSTIPVGAYPHGIRVSPDGRYAYVANLKGGTVSVIDTATREEAARIPAGKGPAQVGFTPDGRYAFVSLSQENAVAVIDPKVRKVVRRIGVGSGPIQVYATPDSRLLFVANQGARKAPGRTVSVIEVGRLAVVKSIETGPGAHGVAVSGDGRYAYVTNIYAGTLSILDVARLEVAATVPVGEEPNGVSVTP